MKQITDSIKMESGFCPEIKDGYALLELARGWLKQGNPVVALELLKSAMNSSAIENDQQYRAKVFKETGRAKMMQSDWESADMYYLEGQRLSLDNNDFKGASECARNRANMYFQKGNYAKSKELCETALDWCGNIEDHSLRATILNTLAVIESATGNYAESIKTFKLCLSDFQSAGNVVRQGYVHLNIGLSQTELSEFDDAIYSLNKSLAIALEEKDLNLVEICYQNIAKCYLAQNENDMAKSVLDTARKILPGLNSKTLEAELELLEAKILVSLGDFDRAEKTLDNLYRFTSDHSLTASTADVLFEQGNVQKEIGAHYLAHAKFKAAANQYKSIGNDNGYKEATNSLDDMKKKLS